jgi:hypothetical protein
MAAWQVRPPWSVTTADAVRRIGSQSGSVMAVTSTEPGLKRCSSAELVRRATGPTPICVPTARPETRTSPRSFSTKVTSFVTSRRAWAVSGRACTMKRAPSRPSLAHSMSMGRRSPALSL